MKTYLNVNFRIEIDNDCSDEDRKAIVDQMTDVLFKWKKEGKVINILEVKNDYRQGKEYDTG